MTPRPLTHNTSHSGLHFVTSPTTLSKSPEIITVVCVHGWACQWSDYEPLIVALTNHSAPKPALQFLAIDLPGHGQTPISVLPEPSIQGFAEEITTLLTDLNLVNVVLIGHSLGCRVALETSLQLRASTSTTCTHLIFLDGSHYALRPRLFAFDPASPRFASISAEETKELKAAAFRRMFGPLTPVKFQEATLEHVTGMDADYSAKLRGAFVVYDRDGGFDMALETFGGLNSGGDAKGPERSKVLHMLSLQSTDVDGEGRRVSLREGETSKWIELLKKKVPRAQIRVVEGCGHFVHVDRPREVARLVLELLKGDPGGKNGERV